MNIKALKAFVTVMEQGSLAAAAEAVFLSKPAVSRLINQLEAEIDLELFDRSGRRLVPTSAGQRFVTVARRILAGMDDADQAIREIRHDEVDRLRILAMAQPVPSLVLPALERHMEQQPDVKCSLEIQHRRELERWITTKRYDVCVATLPVTHPSVHSRPLCRVRVEVLMPVSHHLATVERVTPADLGKERIIGLLPGLFMRRRLDSFMEEAGVDPNVVVETASSLTSCRLVQSGVGLAVIDRLLYECLDMEGLTVRPLDPAVWVQFGLLSFEDQSRTKYADSFVQCLLEIIRQTSQRTGDGAIEDISEY